MDNGEIHIRGESAQTLCGTPGASITRDEALDPDNGETFNCGRCLLVLAGGAEPMGGSAR